MSVGEREALIASVESQIQQSPMNIAEINKRVAGEIQKYTSQIRPSIK